MRAKAGDREPALRRQPAQKPLALLEFLVRTYTRPGGLVLDCCMGSGSTGIAALRCGRRFIGMELNASRFRAGATRVLRSAAQPPVSDRAFGLAMNREREKRKR